MPSLGVRSPCVDESPFQGHDSEYLVFTPPLSHEMKTIVKLPDKLEFIQ